MNNSTKQALETILKTVRASDQFQRHGRELHRITKVQMSNPSEGDLSEIETEAQVWLKAADSAETAGVFKPPYCFLLRACAVESVHRRRLLDGLYNPDLDDISARINTIREREGLDDDEPRPIGQGPEDWEDLEEQYSQILDAKFEETLREYELVDMAELYRQDREAYDALREKGRRLLSKDFSELEQVEAVQQQFEAEAKICAEGRAYHAAAVMIGSAIEAALLFVCLEHREDALDARKRLPNCERPKPKNPIRWHLEDLVRVADEAGWLPNFEVEDGTLSTRLLLDMARNLRNLVHPARHLPDRISPGVKRMYTNAQAAYILLKRHLAEAFI